MEDTYVQLINCRLYIFRYPASSFAENIFFCFPNYQTPVFFLFIPIHHLCFNGYHEENNFVLKSTQMTILRNILFRSALCPSDNWRILSLFYHLIFFMLLQHYFSKQISERKIISRNWAWTRYYTSQAKRKIQIRNSVYRFV